MATGYFGYLRQAEQVVQAQHRHRAHAATADVEQVHRFIRGVLTDRFKEEGRMRILHGGSVKPSNAKELMAVANVNGALVGGASLKAADFLAIAAGC